MMMAMLVVIMMVMVMMLDESVLYPLWQVASKENEDSNPEFKRVLAERAKRLERVSNTDILIQIHNK